MPTTNSIFDQFGGRRFLMCFGCAIACTVLLVMDHITESIFRDIILGTVAVYVAGGTAQKFNRTGMHYEPTADRYNPLGHPENRDRY